MTPTEKAIQDLLLAVNGLEKSQETTVKNVDKIALAMEKLIPVHEKLESINTRVSDLETESENGVRPVTLKHLLIYAVMVAIGFGTWITLYVFSIDKGISSHIVVSDEIIKEMRDDIDYNKNQVTYLKGRLKSEQ